jgi:tetratricopeptide (TPR) repeat protein
MSLQSDLQTCLSLWQTGRHKPLLKAAKKAAGQHKRHSAFPNFAAIALCALDRHREAVPLFAKALQLDPGFTDARKNLAQTLTLLGQHTQAEAQLGRLLRDHGEDSQIWYLMAQVRLGLGDLASALEAADRAVALAPRDGGRYNLRGIIRQRLGRTAGAIEDFEAAVELNPMDVDALVNMSLPLARQTRTEEALAAVSRALELAPDHIGARLRLAAQQVELGDTDAACAQYREVVARMPEHPKALEQLALLNGAEDNRALAPKLRAALKSVPRKGEARASLLFGLALIAEQEGDAEGFSKALTEANALMSEVMPQDPESDARQAEAILKRFAQAASPASETTESPVPIYVLGLPRSGTTLAEAILGAHDAVAPLGERTAAAMLLAKVIDEGRVFDADEAARFRDGLRAELPDLPEDTRAYVDKMPENYRLIGFLLAAQPGVRIVNMRRDPRDIALSMWRGHFSSSVLGYTYDLAAMAARFNLYARMMQAWHIAFPGRILDVSYESLVADVETEGRRMAEFCGLDWQPQMARPDLSVTQVLTMSATQLRQPVHARSVGKWREHADMLAPFVAGLDRDLWPGLRD